MPSEIRDVVDLALEVAAAFDRSGVPDVAFTSGLLRADSRKYRAGGGWACTLVVPVPVLVEGFVRALVPVRVPVVVFLFERDASTSAGTGTMPAARTGTSTIHRRLHPHQHAVSLPSEQFQWWWCSGSGSIASGPSFRERTAIRFPALRSRRTSSRLMFCRTSTYAFTSSL
jgi:hypothetical protein